MCDRKGSRENENKPGRSRKRSFHGNRHTSDADSSLTSTSAKKIHNGDPDFQVVVDPTMLYCIVSYSVFLALQNIVICKTCKSEVRFSKFNQKGLGFDLNVACKCENDVRIPSSPKISSGYEINRRFAFVMRLLGIGIQGLNNFCGLMDLCTGFSENGYYDIVNHIHIAAKSVALLAFKKAVNEEKKANAAAGKIENRLTVSGDGSWPKRGFSSLLGLVSLIGKYTNKVLDLEVKSKFCRACETYDGDHNTPEFEAWFEDHEQDCTANHEGSSGMMESNGILDMFKRSIELFKVIYEYYIGDSDTKTFKNVIDEKPYGDEVIVKKKECVLHVKKRLFRRAKDAKKQLTQLKKAKKAIEEAALKKSGAKKSTSKKNADTPKTLALTGKVMSELSAFYGIAVLNHPDSPEEMKKAIWATFYHRSSTDENPQHQYCPDDSWCKYRLAAAKNKLSTFKHPPAFDNDTQAVLKPIYEDLTSEDLLERCTGANTQNNNESFNSCVWAMAPKHTFCGKKIVEIAAYTAACTFNEGFSTVLKIMSVMGVTIGSEAQKYAEKVNATRVRKAERVASQASKESRLARRNARIRENDAYEEAEGVIYGAGIAD